MHYKVLENTDNWGDSLREYVDFSLDFMYLVVFHKFESLLAQNKRGKLAKRSNILMKFEKNLKPNS